jgi:anti-sigma regulatory factor (Ser/Thr protein kinase)
MGTISASTGTRQFTAGLKPTEAGTLLGYVHLPARAELVRHARELVRLVLRSNGAASSAADDTVLIISELVTNVVRYCDAALDPIAVITLSRLDASLQIEVHDPNPSLPTHRMPDSGEEYGRGLTIIDALSDRWGHDVTSEGKRMWCELTAWPSETADRTP